MTPEFQSLLREFKAIQEEAGEAFKEQALQFLRDNEESELVAMRWAQYAPFFNDGEICEFEVQSMAQFRTKGEDNFDDTDFEPPTWSSDSFRPLEAEAEELLFSVHPEVLYQLFGADVAVVVSLDSEPFSTYEYDEHD
jgi:hypothetical protein